MAFSPPVDRDGFQIAIVCALPTEYNAVSLTLDEFWDDQADKYGKAEGDPNHYTTGRIAKYDVVVALLPHMGKVNAASAAASMRSSFGRLRLALLVGVCGGVPFGGHGELLLGDVVISDSIVQYDFGRQNLDKFERKDTVADNLGRPNKDIRSLLSLLGTDRGMESLETRTSYCLVQLQAKAATKRRIGKDRYKYPGVAEDKLFDPGYRHQHRGAVTCACRDCVGDQDPVCESAVSSTCAEIGCDEARLLQRDRLDEKRQLERENTTTAQQPLIHIGTIACGDTVIKSAMHRNKLAQQKKIIAIEMEGAGVWDEVPCIVVKGVCDYADCHKHKGWQNFAAATAAATAKAILERYTQTDKNDGSKAVGAGQFSEEKTITPTSSLSTSGIHFNGPISGRTVLAGSTMSGGTYNFG